MRVYEQILQEYKQEKREGNTMGKSIKLTEEQAEGIFKDDLEDFEVVRAVEWEDEGKYDIGVTIFKYQGVTYALETTRSGSYYTDYDYEHHLRCPEVEEVEVVRKVWRTVGT